jgi:hypothetical protein
MCKIVFECVWVKTCNNCEINKGLVN